MSDAHLSERSLIDGPEPIELSPEPILLSNLDPEKTEKRSTAGSRRRRVALGIAAVAAFAGAAAIGTAGWRVVQQKDAELAAPAQAAGFNRDDSERARSTADYLRSGFAANIDLDRSFGAVYRDPADEKRLVLIFGGATLLWQPERDLDSLFNLMTDETGAVTGLREVPAGELGGVMKCGSTTGEGGDFTVCGWADHGSVGMAMFPGRPVNTAADLFRRIRNVVQTRP